jgi:hypothetical protein
MRKGIVRISEKLLLDWLQYSGGHIVGARVDPFAGGGFVELAIEHSEMPEVDGGAIAPFITPIFRHTFDKNGHLIEVVRDAVS